MPATGTNGQDIAYGGYINTVGAGLTISQLTGGNAHANMRISLWKAGGGTTPEESFSYIDNAFTNESTISDDTALHDDALVSVGQVKVTHAGVVLTWGTGGAAFGTTQSGVKVSLVDAFATINAPGLDSFEVTGLGSLDNVDWTAAGGASFNRIKLTALATTSAFDLGGLQITEGTTSSAGLGSHLLVDDDAPTITAPGTQPILTVDETTLSGDDTKGFAGAFTSSFGSDGAEAGGGIVYTLGIGAGSTGLFDTATGAEAVLSLVGGQVLGKVGALTVFVVSVDGTQPSHARPAARGPPQRS
ncbi:hypothetical protein KRR38_33435 [Novosphingobium sp. G106]|uniref:DUF5801 repeats-in-toxin domain-containing protein n=1 Tax=Novosphingobium sp. G106 TaxID=2849500 RepID=UPI001C2DD6CB|nr:DUF5801 repeats-in-toxin domain-containing protein [Novosphingobium sp. G106]MBV1692411.1 hypothetical protein [Novosphingobium sp. G106]